MSKGLHCYSAYRHIEAMAQVVAKSAREAGAQAEVKCVGEIAPQDIARGAYFKLDLAAPIATVQNLTDDDAIVLGLGEHLDALARQGGQ